MATYRYIFGTMLTEQVVEEIPLYGVIMSMEINKGGDFQGTFQLDQTGKNNYDLIGATTPGKTWVSCERNGVCVWHGYIWSRVYSAQSKSMQLFGLSFDNYPKKQLVESDLTFTATEQRNIFRTLWTTMQSAQNANVNINVPAAFADAVLKDLTVLRTDFRYYDEVMSSMADSADGFDWYIAVTKDGTNYRKDLLIGYPNLGVGSSSGMNTFEYPGNITQYYYTEPMADAGTNVFVIGAGEGSSMIVGHVDNTALYAQGWPRWDTDISRKDVSSQSIADSLALQQSEVRLPPMAVIKVTLKGDVTPEFGSYNLGDTCMLKIKDARFPSGFTAAKRLLKWELHPQSSDGVEEASLVFEGDPDV